MMVVPNSSADRADRRLPSGAGFDDKRDFGRQPAFEWADVSTWASPWHLCGGVSPSRKPAHESLLGASSGNILYEPTPVVRADGAAYLSARQ